MRILGSTVIEKTYDFQNSMEQSSENKESHEMRIERSEDIHELPDPDEGKTEEERAAIVSVLWKQEHAPDQFRKTGP